jgi:hypothetical protein
MNLCGMTFFNQLPRFIPFQTGFSLVSEHHLEVYSGIHQTKSGRQASFHGCEKQRGI